MNLDKAMTIIIGIFIMSIASVLIVITLANIVWKQTPQKMGYEQKVIELTCSPQHEIIWVKPDKQ